MSIDRLRAIAQQLRIFAPDKAAQIEAALAEVAAGKRDLATISVGIDFRLQKFEGEYQAGLAPVETIEGKG
ncbi:hypothetical protein NKI61_19980 [Mesorhizobium sp. M0514]|uniref:hypothetical protein n=1 Tax=Mesorhizobium sp. M0514 TaxID=2956955 RepID=UPI003338C37E